MTQGWRIDKHIPIALVFAMFLQTVTLVWWFSGWTARIETRLVELEKERANVKERDTRIRVLEETMGRTQERLKNIDNTTMRIERKLDKISLNMGVPLTLNPVESAYFAMSLEELSEVMV